MQETKKVVISNRVLNMTESATLEMAQKARDLKAKGVDVISLSLGEPDFDTPDHIKEAAKKALDDGFTKYTPVPGLQQIREAISTKFKRDNNLDYAPDQIVVSNGAKQSIANLCLALLNPGDEVIVFSPYWVSYHDVISFSEGVPVPVHAGVEDDFKISASQVENAITDKTKFIIFSSPCNPSGSVYTKDELKEIADVVAKYPDLLIVSDEIYEYINFTGKHASIGAFENVKDQTITINGFSKGFSMTGWRLGYIGAPKWVAKACAKIQGQFTSGATSFGQMAGAHALMSDMSPTTQMREAFLKRRELVKNMLSEIDGLIVNNPQGAFYIFPDCSKLFGKSDGTTTINNSQEFATYLLTKAHVAVVAGSAFGAPNCFRISYAASEASLKEAITRIAKAINALK